MNNILINTKERLSGSTSDFIIELHTPLNGLYTVKNVLITNTSFNVTSLNNVVYFNDGLDQIIYLEAGNHSVTTLLNDLNAKMDAVGADVYTTSLNSITGIITVSSTGTFQFTFGTNTLNSAAGILGYANVDTAVAGTHQASNVVDLATPLSLGIQIDGVSSVGYETANFGCGQIYVPLDVGFGIYKNLPENELRQTILFNHMKRLKVSVRNPSTNSIVGLGNANWEMLLSKLNVN
jgi:hypothetical protein